MGDAKRLRTKSPVPSKKDKSPAVSVYMKKPFLPLLSVAVFNERILLTKNMYKSKDWDEVERRLCSCDLEIKWFDAYKRFLSLKMGFGDFHSYMLAPTAEMDLMWHRHILWDMNSYVRLCMSLCGSVVFHKKIDDAGLLLKMKKDLLDIMEIVFGKLDNSLSSSSSGANAEPKTPIKHKDKEQAPEELPSPDAWTPGQYGEQHGICG